MRAAGKNSQSQGKEMARASTDTERGTLHYCSFSFPLISALITMSKRENHHTADVEHRKRDGTRRHRRGVGVVVKKGPTAAVHTAASEEKKRMGIAR